MFLLYVFWIFIKFGDLIFFGVFNLEHKQIKRVKNKSIFGPSVKYFINTIDIYFKFSYNLTTTHKRSMKHQVNVLQISQFWIE